MCGKNLSLFSTYLGANMAPSCLLYTSPSPRDGLLSIRRQRSDVYKRQDADLFATVPVGHYFLDVREELELVLHVLGCKHGAVLSLIHISEPTRRTPLYSSAAVRCV